MKNIFSKPNVIIFPPVITSRVYRIMEDVELEDVDLDCVDSDDVERQRIDLIRIKKAVEVKNETISKTVVISHVYRIMLEDVDSDDVELDFVDLEDVECKKIDLTRIKENK